MPSKNESFHQRTAQVINVHITKSHDTSYRQRTLCIISEFLVPATKSMLVSVKSNTNTSLMIVRLQMIDLVVRTHKS